MSSFNDVAVEVMVAHITLAADGGFLGIGAAYVACRCLRKLMSTSSALRKIREAPYVQPSDLRSLISDDGSDSLQNSSAQRLVIVRGSVDTLRGSSNALVSKESGDRCVILHRNQIGTVWGGALIYVLCCMGRGKSGRHPQSQRFLLFFLKRENGQNLILLLSTWKDQDIRYLSLQFISICSLQIGVLEEEKILPLGKDISVVGICNLRNGIPEINSCKDLPYYLSELTKDQILADLSFKTKVLMWSGILFGSLAIGILGYSIARWRRRIHLQRFWRENETRYAQLVAEAETEVVPNGEFWQLNDSAGDEISAEVEAEEETEDVPDGELCVVCLLRRRRSALLPCGHLVCCRRCALSIERETSPECPVCRQLVRRSVRIHRS